MRPRFRLIQANTAQAPVYVGIKDGKVSMNFGGYDISSLALTPETAKAIGQALIDRARDLQEKQASPIVLPRSVM